jgi:hypothetical protein
MKWGSAWGEAEHGKFRCRADPFEGHRPTRSGGELGERFGRELVRVLGMQELARLEREGVPSGIDNLIGQLTRCISMCVRSAFGGAMPFRRASDSTRGSGRSPRTAPSRWRHRSTLQEASFLAPTGQRQRRQRMRYELGASPLEVAGVARLAGSLPALAPLGLSSYWSSSDCSLEEVCVEHGTAKHAGAILR